MRETLEPRTTEGGTKKYISNTVRQYARNTEGGSPFARMRAQNIKYAHTLEGGTKNIFKLIHRASSAPIGGFPSITRV